MRIVVAIGGNALLQRGDPPTGETQGRNVAAAVAAIADLAAEHDVIVTHGNGPQVGLLALRTPGVPLDVLDAETEGRIGYLLEQGLENALPDRAVATLLTQVAVDPGDPAFQQPTKPIGPWYSAETAASIASERGWTIARDGARFRRVVASPEPLAIIEIQTIRLLVEHGVLVVCVGGGGIPVFAGEDGALHGIEAVIDKDLAAGLLASLLDADYLLMLTDVAGVELDWPAPGARPIRLTSSAELRGLDLPAGSMGPKVEAACRFVETTGGRAGIGALTEAAAIVRGEKGTTIEAQDARRSVVSTSAMGC